MYSSLFAMVVANCFLSVLVFVFRDSEMFAVRIDVSLLGLSVDVSVVDSSFSAVPLMSICISL